ncbi:MAG: ribonuclease J [Oscillospiraceae bacterium]|nr:ribonuclease J [Oscillospiraceae bacterium]
MANKLKIISLGGLNEIGKNMTVFEYGRDIIVVDCGLGFPEDDMYGVDLVIPDFTYLAKNRDRIRGLFLTHGHEDHIGAIPYAMREFRAPIHATRLTAGLVRLKLEEHGIERQVKLHTHEAGDIVQAGCFQVEFIRVNHSIADACAFAIKTPVGTVLMTGDFKIDSMAAGGMTDLGRFGQLGKDGVLAFLCDSTNVENPGYSASESLVAEGFDRQFKGCSQRIIVTTFASNAYRLQSLLNVAHRYGRKVAVTGRSMENVLKVSLDLGYLKAPKDTLVDISEIKNLPKNKVVIVSTGSQGENMSALYRMAFSMHKQVEIQPGDRVIISASAIPGNEKSIGKIINELYAKGAEVVHDKAADLHASGHACREELKIVHALVHPRFFLPVHGEQRHLRAHAMLAQQMGMNPKNIFIGSIGQVFEFTRTTCRQTGAVPAGKVLVDGSGIGDVGGVVLRDRRKLAEEGVVMVVVGFSRETGAVVTGPEIVTRGFIYEKESEEVMEQLRAVAQRAVQQTLRHNSRDWGSVRTSLRQELAAFLRAHGRDPMILPVLLAI